jgi:hypothetical protein
LTWWTIATGKHRGQHASKTVRRIKDLYGSALLDVVLGGVAPTAEHARQMIKRGYRLLMIGFDWALLQRGIAAALDGMR